jgi:hypothetical protein
MRTLLNIVLPERVPNSDTQSQLSFLWPLNGHVCGSFNLIFEIILYHYTMLQERKKERNILQNFPKVK